MYSCTNQETNRWVRFGGCSSGFWTRITLCSRWKTYLLTLYFIFFTLALEGRIAASCYIHKSVHRKALPQTSSRIQRLRSLFTSLDIQSTTDHQHFSLCESRKVQHSSALKTFPLKPVIKQRFKRSANELGKLEDHVKLLPEFYSNKNKNIPKKDWTSAIKYMSSRLFRDGDLFPVPVTVGVSKKTVKSDDAIDRGISEVHIGYLKNWLKKTPTLIHEPPRIPVPFKLNPSIADEQIVYNTKLPDVSRVLDGTSPHPTYVKDLGNKNLTSEHSVTSVSTPQTNSLFYQGENLGIPTKASFPKHFTDYSIKKSIREELSSVKTTSFLYDRTLLSEKPQHSYSESHFILNYPRISSSSLRLDEVPKTQRPLSSFTFKSKGDSDSSAVYSLNPALSISWHLLKPQIHWESTLQAQTQSELQTPFTLSEMSNSIPFFSSIKEGINHPLENTQSLTPDSIHLTSERPVLKKGDSNKEIGTSLSTPADNSTLFALSYTPVKMSILPTTGSHSTSFTSVMQSAYFKKPLVYDSELSVSKMNSVLPSIPPIQGHTTTLIKSAIPFAETNYALVPKTERTQINTMVNSNIKTNYEHIAILPMVSSTKVTNDIPLASTPSKPVDLTKMTHTVLSSSSTMTWGTSVLLDNKTSVLQEVTPSPMWSHQTPPLYLKLTKLLTGFGSDFPLTSQHTNSVFLKSFHTQKPALHAVSSTSSTSRIPMSLTSTQTYRTFTPVALQENTSPVQGHQTPLCLKPSLSSTGFIACILSKTQFPSIATSTTSKGLHTQAPLKFPTTHISVMSSAFTSTPIQHAKYMKDKTLNFSPTQTSGKFKSLTSIAAASQEKTQSPVNGHQTPLNLKPTNFSTGVLLKMQTPSISANKKDLHTQAALLAFPTSQHAYGMSSTFTSAPTEDVTNVEHQTQSSRPKQTSTMLHYLTSTAVALKDSTHSPVQSHKTTLNPKSTSFFSALITSVLLSTETPLLSTSTTTKGILSQTALLTFPTTLHADRIPSTFTSAPIKSGTNMEHSSNSSRTQTFGSPTHGKWLPQTSTEVTLSKSTLSNLQTPQTSSVIQNSTGIFINFRTGLWLKMQTSTVSAESKSAFKYLSIPTVAYTGASPFSATSLSPGLTSTPTKYITKMMQRYQSTSPLQSLDSWNNWQRLPQSSAEVLSLSSTVTPVTYSARPVTSAIYGLSSLLQKDRAKSSTWTSSQEPTLSREGNVSLTHTVTHRMSETTSPKYHVVLESDDPVDDRHIFPPTKIAPVITKPLTFHLMEIVFSEELQNSRSKEYRELEREMKLVLNKIFLEKYGSDYLQSYIEQFLNGSVVVKSQILFNGQSPAPSNSNIVRTVLTNIYEQGGTYFGWKINSSSVESNGLTLNNLEPECLSISFLVLRIGYVARSQALKENHLILENLGHEVVDSIGELFHLRSFNISHVRDLHGDLEVKGNLYLDTRNHTNVGNLLPKLSHLLNSSVDLSSVNVDGQYMNVQVFPIRFRIKNLRFDVKMLDLSSYEFQFYSKQISEELFSMMKAIGPRQVIIRELLSGSVLCKGSIIFQRPSPKSEDVLKIFLGSLGKNGALGSLPYFVDAASVNIGDSAPGPYFEYIDFPGYAVAIIVMCGLCILIFPALVYVLYKTRMLGHRKKATIRRPADPDMQSRHFEMDNCAFRASIEQP